jgi:hypothetical protein
LANISTSGGSLADRALLRLAEQFDYEASCLEQHASPHREEERDNGDHRDASGGQGDAPDIAARR